jgi:hypothetical protein
LPFLELPKPPIGTSASAAIAGRVDRALDLAGMVL